MVLAARTSHVKWAFVALVASAPVNRWLAAWMEDQPSSCPSQILFGVACPMCGGTRAALYLASGDLSSAVQSNVGAVVFALVVAAVLVQQQRSMAPGLTASMEADST